LHEIFNLGKNISRIKGAIMRGVDLMSIDTIFDEKDFNQACEWWENLPAVTRIAIFQDLWGINEFDE